MAKRRAAKRRSATRRSVSRSSNLLGIKYDSLTFLLLLVFVLVVAMVLFSKALGMGGY